jgi:hypothetical protein
MALATPVGALLPRRRVAVLKRQLQQAPVIRMFQRTAGKRAGKTGNNKMVTRHASQ